MGGKPSNSFQSDRPESGGADRNDIREESGLLERDKEKFAQSQHEAREQEVNKREPSDTELNDRE